MINLFYIFFYNFLFLIQFIVECQNQNQSSLKVPQRYIPFFSPFTPFLTQQSLPGPQFGRPSQPSPNQQKHFRHHHSLDQINKFNEEKSNEKENKNETTFPKPLNSLEEFANKRGILINKTIINLENSKENNLNLKSNEEFKKEKIEENFRKIEKEENERNQQKENQNFDFVAAQFPINNETKNEKENEKSLEKWHWKDNKLNNNNEKIKINKIPSSRQLKSSEEKNIKKDNSKSNERFGRNKWEENKNKQKQRFIQNSKSDERNERTSKELSQKQRWPKFQNEEQRRVKEHSSESNEHTNHPNSESREHWSSKHRPLASSNSREEINQREKQNNYSNEQQNNNRRGPPPPKSPPLIFSNSPFQPPRKIPHPTDFFPEHIRNGFPPFPEPFENNDEKRNEE